MTQKWKTLRSETIVKDRWINLSAETCFTPGGAEISPYYVLHYPDWVHVVAITDDLKIVMVREYRHAAGEYFLGLPSGAVESTDVSLEEAACRELGEETGYWTETLKLVASLHSDPAHHSNLIHTLVATGVVNKHLQRLDMGEEGLTVELVPIAEAIEGARDGRIPYSGHVSSIVLGLAASGHLDMMLI